MKLIDVEDALNLRQESRQQTEVTTSHPNEPGDDL
jgi:hypothetical protein